MATRQIFHLIWKDINHPNSLFMSQKQRPTKPWCSINLTWCTPQSNKFCDRSHIGSPPNSPTRMDSLLRLPNFKQCNTVLCEMQICLSIALDFSETKPNLDVPYTLCQLHHIHTSCLIWWVLSRPPNKNNHTNASTILASIDRLERAV